jgi:hypothetical protein
MTDYEISEEPPRDEGGHPVHPDPDKDHRICAATKSDRTTPTEHGRERDDVPYCTLAAGWGVDDTQTGTCSHHLGAVDNRGENNPNYEHGAYSEFTNLLESDLSEREQKAMNGLDLDEHGDEFVRDAIKEAYIKYKRTGDDRFMREVRQWLSEFNIVDNTDQVELEGVDLSLTAETKDQLDEMFDEQPR